MHLNLIDANALVARLHRHHQPAPFHYFSIGVCNGHGQLCGAAIIARPVARLVDARRTLEIVRLVTDGTKNACSMLYASAARIAGELGYEHIQTYILEDEPGTSLLAAGWQFEAGSKGGDWNRDRAGRDWIKRPGHLRNRVDQPLTAKQRWGKRLIRWQSCGAEHEVEREPKQDSGYIQLALDMAEDITEAAVILVDAIEDEDPDWMTAYDWLREAVRGEACQT